MTGAGQIWMGILEDGGPVYAETNLSHLVAEPFNASTALPFLFIGVFWLVRLRDRRAEIKWIYACLVLLAVGGVGGTLYHAFRVSRVFYLMDIMPIALIGLLLSVYLWKLSIGRLWPGLAAFFLAMVVEGASVEALSRHVAITISYGLMAGLILTPLAVHLARRRGAHWPHVAAAVALFAVAVFFRVYDALPHASFPMGTHWLWHGFSALAVWFLVVYLYLEIDGSAARRLP